MILTSSSPFYTFMRTSPYRRRALAKGSGFQKLRSSRVWSPSTTGNPAQSSKRVNHPTHYGQLVTRGSIDERSEIKLEGNPNREKTIRKSQNNM